MATSKTAIKQLADEVLTILRQDGWMSEFDMHAKLAQKDIEASSADIHKIFEAIRTIHKLITEFSFDLQSPLEPKR